MTMSPIRVFSIVVGIFFLAIGIAGFIPIDLWPPVAGRTDQVLHWFDGRLFNFLHVNGVLNIWHIVLGVGGIAMGTNLRLARAYDEALSIALFCLVLLGLTQQTDTLMGIAPMHGHSLLVYFLISIAAAVFGYIVPPVRRAEVVSSTPQT